MEQMSEKDILTYLRENIEPLEKFYGASYRASVYLVDGLYLPCVVFRNPNQIVEFAMKRFEKEQSGQSIFRNHPDGYKETVKSLVTTGNCINVYDIARVEKSKCAFPVSILKQIRGETSMGWTGFSAKMKDGKYLGFGTTLYFDFFHMPDNYTVEDIDEIINNSYVLKTGELWSYKRGTDNYKDAVVYRERPFFECYIDDL